ncbi:MAG: hypothetical protein LV479_12655 [Methylacidiphilales bacterium]|nr:hypothetical protein [Candidatus Methylacidiphilales bacterium]
MKTSSSIFAAMLTGLLLLMVSARASTPHVWYVTSPDYGQTFAYGSEQSRAWGVRGTDRHLALYLNYTNDPFVDRNNPRQYDNFVFNFPQITFGRDGHTFYYHTPKGRLAPVASRRPGFLGIEEIKLLDTSNLLIKKPHGYVTVMLEIWG